jgi:hypothetical protein
MGLRDVVEGVLAEGPLVEVEEQDPGGEQAVSGIVLDMLQAGAEHQLAQLSGRHSVVDADLHVDEDGVGVHVLQPGGGSVQDLLKFGYLERLGGPVALLYQHLRSLLSGKSSGMLDPKLAASPDKERGWRHSTCYRFNEIPFHKFHNI